MITMNSNEIFMKRALELAREAYNEKEVPVGAIVVFENKIIATGKNRRERSKSSLHHAEIEALSLACNVLSRWRLTGCDLFVTLEPCPMCAGAIINSRITNLVYGADDPKSGSCGSVVNLFDLPYNHKPNVTAGVLEQECSCILSEFFQEIRRSDK